jgi:glycosyltransferase involved in cell wall biosynthesis
MVFFSIIIPIYKVEDYLCECISSVLAQTFLDYECILVDDGSPDNCPDICDEYASKNERFRVIHQENAGLSIARNVGINIAGGEYIVLLDGDDLFASNLALQNLYNIIQETKTEVIYHSKLEQFTTQSDRKILDIINEKIYCYNTRDFFAEIQQSDNTILAGWLFTINRKFLLKNNLFFKEKILHEDDHWVPRLFCSMDQIAINHNSFYSYRYQRPGSIMSTLNQKRLTDSIFIIKDLQMIAKREKLKYKKEIYYYFCKSYWFSIFTSLSNYNLSQEDQREIVKKLKKNVFCILHPITIKRFMLFICIMIFGIINAAVIRNFLQGKKHGFNG